MAIGGHDKRNTAPSSHHRLAIAHALFGNLNALRERLSLANQTNADRVPTKLQYVTQSLRPFLVRFDGFFIDELRSRVINFCRQRIWVDLNRDGVFRAVTRASFTSPALLGMNRLRTIVHDVDLCRAEPLAQPALDAGVAVDRNRIRDFVTHLILSHPANILLSVRF